MYSQSDSSCNYSKVHTKVNFKQWNYEFSTSYCIRTPSLQIKGRAHAGTGSKFIVLLYSHWPALIMMTRTLLYIYSIETCYTVHVNNLKIKKVPKEKYASCVFMKLYNYFGSKDQSFCFLN